MTDLRELYQSVILDHNRKPRNFRAIEGAAHTAHGRNPLCGDEVQVFVRLEGDTVADVSFTGQGCAISRASASLMTTAIKGKPRAEVDRLFARFHALVLGKDPVEDVARGDLGQLVVFGGVSKYPVRVKCASLAWHTLKAALADGDAVVSTEGASDPVPGAPADPTTGAVS
ncbi:MAG: SUF system NifU family Fe-S cluster assembly protein [Gemmatimonadaceae bacterium]|nr:SUF system NifU family Fe-S cluster assembly protein [Gemmatimonadaceae bacterium]